MMGRDKAIVTLTVGAGLRERWERVCAPGWRAYAERHGYDLLVLDRPLDGSRRARERSPAWQKCLIAGQEFAAAYERLVWIDADVLINPDAPCVVEGVPAGRVGAVDEYATPDPEGHARALATLYAHWDATATTYVPNPRPHDYYEASGLPPFDHVVQTGVLVLEAGHREILERVYDRFEERGVGWNYEMRPLSAELLGAGTVAWLDSRFNYLWGIYKALHAPQLVARPDDPNRLDVVRRALADVHFLHFAGTADEMPEAAVDPAPADPSPALRAPRSRRPPATRTPVLLLLHRRPDTSAAVLDAIRSAGPSRLLVAADGARDDEEAELCARTRALVEEVDWPCTVETDFAIEHLGLGARVVSALDWALDRTESVIVLEDDCVPDPTFFGFCDELLARFADDDRVVSIGGADVLLRGVPSPHSYRFSRYPAIWGWATWRRAWAGHDPAMRAWPRARAAGRLTELLGDPRAVAYWTHVLDRASHEPDAWDHAWTLSCWLRDGLHVLPTTNLVRNVGFRADATHTRPEHAGVVADLPARPMAFPLAHPPTVVRDLLEDADLEDLLYSGNVGRMLARVRAARRERAAAS